MNKYILIELGLIIVISAITNYLTSLVLPLGVQEQNPLNAYLYFHIGVWETYFLDVLFFLSIFVIVYWFSLFTGMPVILPIFTTILLIIVSIDLFNDIIAVTSYGVSI